MKTTSKTNYSAEKPQEAPYELFDFDCNLTHPDLIEIAEDLVRKSTKYGISRMLVPGASLAESKESIELCKRFPQVRI